MDVWQDIAEELKIKTEDDLNKARKDPKFWNNARDNKMLEMYKPGTYAFVGLLMQGIENYQVREIFLKQLRELEDEVSCLMTKLENSKSYDKKDLSTDIDYLEGYGIPRKEAEKFIKGILYWRKP